MPFSLRKSAMPVVFSKHKTGSPSISASIATLGSGSRRDERSRRSAALIRKLDLACRAQNFHLRPDSGPLHLVGEIGRIAISLSGSNPLPIQTNWNRSPPGWLLMIVAHSMKRSTPFLSSIAAEADHQEFPVPRLWRRFRVSQSFSLHASRRHREWRERCISLEAPHGWTCPDRARNPQLRFRASAWSRTPSRLRA